MDTRAENRGNSSKRRKLSTTKYLRKTRFEEGRGSDVKIVALNREWNLHKIFLEKSPYFECMFSGPWIETAQKEINLKIEDVNITAEALHKVFESLYIDEIQIEDTEVIPILACASLFQLDDLIDNCTEVMKACMNMDNALRFYEASDLYGMKEAKNIASDWLHRNIQCFPPSKLSSFGVDLMREIFSSPEICMSDEENVFFFLCFYMFLKENIICSSENYDTFKNMVKDNAKAMQNNFKRLKCEKPFLETDSAMKYQPLFRTLRLKNLILYGNIEAIQSYDIIPKDWFIPVFQSQWYHLSRIFSGKDIGPNSEGVSEEEFNRECVRESGCLCRDEPRICSRRCFDFGFGLNFKYKGGCFCIVRRSSVALDNTQRNLMYRITLYGVDNNRRVLSKLETGLKTVSMPPNFKCRALIVKPPMTFPIRYRINFLLTSPLVAGSSGSRGQAQGHMPLPEG